MGALVLLMVILAISGHTADANWCVCRSDVGDAALQTTLDYACGAGADCNPLHQNGPCYQPNTLRAHCSYAVNSYYQNKKQALGTCDFKSAATVVTSDPSPGGTCTFPASASVGGGGGGGINVTPSTPGTTPSISTPGTTPTTGTPSTFTPTTGGFTPTSGGLNGGLNNPNNGGGALGGGISSSLGPSGSGFNTDTSDSHQKSINFLHSFLLTLWVSGFFLLWV